MQPPAACPPRKFQAYVRPWLIALAMAGLSACSSRLSAADQQADQQTYQQQIKPLLAARCLACHGVLKQEAGLRLDTGLLLKQGSSSGPIIEPGNSAASGLIARVTSTNLDERMPPEGEPLTADQIALLAKWIDAGALSPEDEQPEQDPREHWSFQSIERPQVPSHHLPWGNGPIDSLIAARLEQQQLTPQRPATRSELIRRLYLDIVGMPPALEELDQLAADLDPGWYERLVDRLLEDPRYGQRWGRHWMDIWRYSDWWGLGDQLRNSQMHIWHWRDWIVESLNSDLPYDEMIRLMIAGDELAPTDQQRLRATGYLARNYFLFNRHQWMDETVEHIGKGILGLTLNCAKCHDHKTDPIKQTDYYRLRAFFEPYHVRLDMIPGQTDLARDGLPRVFESQQEIPTYLFVRGQETQPDKSSVMTPGLPDILVLDELKIESVTLPAQAWQLERRDDVQAAFQAAADARVTAAQTNLQAALDQLNKVHSQAAGQPASALADAAANLRLAQADLAVATEEKSVLLLRLTAMRAQWALADAPEESDKQTLQANLKATTLAAVSGERHLELARSQHKLAGAELNLLRAAADQREAVDKELLAAREALTKSQAACAAEIKPEDTYQPLVASKWTATRFLNSGADDPSVASGPKSSGRRTALARWLTDRRNPLTARVAANHIWMRHTGQSLVPNVFDLGRKSPAPNNQQLLDWLASELIDSGWSMKHLHRLILNSQTYRMSSSTLGQTDNVARDPDNNWHWRHNSTRMESQVVRDSVLALTGSLDLTAGGPPIMPNEQLTSKRRSLYFFHSNNDRNLFLTTFDEAAVKDCYRREQSIVPQQALALTNSQLILDAAEPIAQKLLAHLPASAATDERTFIQHAFVYVLGIEAGDQELARCQAALRQWQDNAAENATGQKSPTSSHGLLVWALLNHTDFVTMR